MSNDLKVKTFGGLAGLIFVGILAIIAWFICTVSDYSQWNDGHCECGGTWVYEQAVGHYYSTEYLYHCDRCGKVIELSDRR